MSTGQIGRLTAEYKALVSQNEEMKRSMQELERRIKAISTDRDNKVNTLTQ